MQGSSSKARSTGIRVPDEAAIVGVDNDLPPCEVCSPPLSSVNANHTQVGYLAAALLDRLMCGRRPPAKPILVAPLGVELRRSTDVLAIDDPHTAAAIRFIRDHACQGVTVDDVVQHVPLSRSVLQRRFHQCLGHTPHEEIVRTRVRRAQDLLAHTTMALVDVAERCGFKHQEYMGVVFRARLGMTPAQYRRKSRI